MKRILITGATGCVGHYVVEALSKNPDVELVLYARHPDKLRLMGVAPERVTWIKDDIRNVTAHSELLTGLNGVVHIATAWGDPEAYPINVDATLELVRLTDPAPFVYFSTASILDTHNKPWEIADKKGTDYIRSKYQAYSALRKTTFGQRAMVLFPTVVFGGSPQHPASHASRGLERIIRWLWLLRSLTCDGSLQFVHAADIAKIVAHLLDVPQEGSDWVLGGPCYTVNQIIAGMCLFYGFPRGETIDLTPYTPAIARIAGNRMNSWDRVCLTQRHFCYTAAKSSTFGLEAGIETIEEILAERNVRHVPVPQV